MLLAIPLSLRTFAIILQESDHLHSMVWAFLLPEASVNWYMSLLIMLRNFRSFIHHAVCINQLNHFSSPNQFFDVRILTQNAKCFGIRICLPCQCLSCPAFSQNTSNWLQKWGCISHNATVVWFNVLHCGMFTNTDTWKWIARFKLYCWC